MNCIYLLLLSFFIPLCGMQEESEQGERKQINLLTLGLQVMQTPEKTINLPTNDVRDLIAELAQLRKERGALKIEDDEITSETSELTKSYHDNEGMSPFLDPNGYLDRLSKNKSEDEVNRPSNLVLFFTRQVQDLMNRIEEKTISQKLTRSVSSGNLGLYKTLEDKFKGIDGQFKEVSKHQTELYRRVEEQFNLLRTYLTVNVTNEIKNLALDIENMKKRFDEKKTKKKLQQHRKSTDNSRSNIIFSKSKRNSVKKRKKSDGSDRKNLSGLENKDESDSPTSSSPDELGIVDRGNRRSRSSELLIFTGMGNEKDIGTGKIERKTSNNQIPIPTFPSSNFKKLTTTKKKKKSN